MKKILFVLLFVALVALVLVVACAPSAPAPASTVPTSSTPLCEPIARGQGLVVVEKQKYSYECKQNDETKGMVEIKDGVYTRNADGSQRMIFTFGGGDFFYGCGDTCIFSYEGVSVQTIQQNVVVLIKKAGQIVLRMRVGSDGKLLVEESKPAN